MIFDFFAASCLHLKPKDLSRFDKAIEHLESLERHNPVMILAGDIIDSDLEWGSVLSHVYNVLDDRGIRVFVVPGNNDLRAWETVGISRTNADRDLDVVGVTGVNWLGPPWSAAHDLHSRDYCQTYFKEAIFSLGNRFGGLEHSKILVMHYPPFSYLYRGANELEFAPGFLKFLDSFPELEHIVLGHVHSYVVEGASGAVFDHLDLVPSIVNVGGREIKVTLASDHRKHACRRVGSVRINGKAGI